MNKLKDYKKVLDLLVDGNNQHLNDNLLKVIEEIGDRRLIELMENCGPTVRPAAAFGYIVAVHEFAEDCGGQSSNRSLKKIRNREILAEYKQLRKSHKNETKSFLCSVLAEKHSLSQMQIKKILTALGHPEFNLKYNQLKYAI